MNKITLLAIALTGVIASAVFAEESSIPFGDGEAILISPDGTVHKSNTKVSTTNHEAALAKGAREISRGMLIYKHEGKLYSMNCARRLAGGSRDIPVRKTIAEPFGHLLANSLLWGWKWPARAWNWLTILIWEL